jgi:hypothetical protein
MTMRLLTALALATAATATFAKLPAPDDAAKAKAAETSAKAAWQAKVDAWQLCKSQDRTAAKFGGKGQGAKAPAAAVKTAAAPASAASNAAGDKPTPVPTAGTPPPPCADPGPFAYNPPQQTPLESSGAHSPAGNAASPPSVRAESATMAPAKK